MKKMVNQKPGPSPGDGSTPTPDIKRPTVSTHLSHYSTPLDNDRFGKLLHTLDATSDKVYRCPLCGAAMYAEEVRECAGCGSETVKYDKRCGMCGGLVVGTVFCVRRRKDTQTPVVVEESGKV